MAGQVGDLLAALRGEVDRIVQSKVDEDLREELSELLIFSISATLHDIRMGAQSDEFQELTVLNFVVSADGAGHSKETISAFVRELNNVKKARKGPKL